MTNNRIRMSEQLSVTLFVLVLIIHEVSTVSAFTLSKIKQPSPRFTCSHKYSDYDYYYGYSYCLTKGYQDVTMSTNKLSLYMTRQNRQTNNQENEPNNNNNSNSNSNNNKFVDKEMLLLNERLFKMRATILENEIFNRPPNPELSPYQFVTAVLEALRDPDHPTPNSGYRVLVRSSSSKWLNTIKQYIGVPQGNDENKTLQEDLLVSALGTAISRPKNQYGILVSADDDNHNTENQYQIYFPGDILDYDDGKCWIECQLRNVKDNSLLVILGWQLVRREQDNAWLIESLDWQDFRDDYRPGIGREEWMRICG